MKLLLVYGAVPALCAVLVFLAPHHRRRPESFQACTLAELYRSFFRDMPSVLSPRTQGFALLGVVGVIACFYPAVLLIALRWLDPAPGPGGGAALVAGGILGLAGAAVNFLGMLISHMNFAFGGSQSTKDQTVFLFLIPLFQAAFALASIAIGTSSTCAQWAHRLVSM